MRRLMMSRISKMNIFCHNQHFRIVWNTLESRYSFKRPFSASFKVYRKVYDHNFNFFHQNPAYGDTFLQNCTKDVGNSSNILEKIKGNIAHLSKDKVVQTMEFIARANIRINEKSSILKMLDKKCCSVIHEWPLDTTLYVFDAWFVILNKKAFLSQYFSTAMDIWFKNIEEFSKNNVIQIIYYLGLNPRFPKAMVENLIKILNEKQCEMTDIEVAIVCLSFFRLRIKSVPNELLERAIQIAYNLMSKNERFHLISILKFLRQLQHYDNELCYALQRYVIETCKSFNFVECTNFLATFSTQSVYNENLFKLVEEQATSLLDIEKLNDRNSNIQDHPSKRTRVKDLSRYLWALVNVGHPLKSDTIETVLSLVRMKFSEGEYQNQLYYLVDCLQSFSLVDIYPEDLLKQIFERNFLEQLQKTIRVKPLFQIYLLYKSIEIERPELFKSIFIDDSLKHQLKPLPKDLDKQIQDRKDVTKIVNLINDLCEPGIEVELCCNLPHIIILGIVVKNSKSSLTVNNKHNEIHIEVLDPAVCCRDSIHPLGLMNAKLRQLRKLNLNVVVMTQDSISTINEISLDNQLFKMREILCL